MDKSPSSPPLLVACDDTATVEAAFDLLDHCDDPLTDLPDPDQAQDFDVNFDNVSEFLDHVNIPELTTSTQCNSAPNRPHNVVVVAEQSKRRRTTPKQEIAQLRAEERDLACKLELLRLQAYDQKQRGSSTTNDKVLPFWKKIASRQHRSRVASERENRRLRSLVAVHIGRAKRLKVAWKKQMTEEGYNKENAASSLNPEYLFSPDTPTVMKQLTEEADAVYSDLDAFLQGARSHRRNQVPFLEHGDSYSVPFERQVVDRAIWFALASRFRGVLQRVQVTEDTITCSALRTHRMGNMDMCIRVRWIGRKYREVDRTIFITRVFLEPLHQSVPATVGFRETQVSIVTPTLADSPSSRVNTHASVTGDGPDDGTGDGMRSWMASSAGVAVRDVWMHVFQVRKNAIEDQLFQESRSL